MNKPQAANPDDLPTHKALLSSLMDGEGDAAQAETLCQRWSSDTETQADWHAYHLIGDVLRSEELGGRSRDAAFLHKLQQRLADEPVVLAPAVLATPTPGGVPRQRPAVQRALRRWGAPLGIAAGVALVSSAVWVTRPDANLGTGASQLASTTTTPASGVLAVSGLPARGAGAAQFGRYLSAHKQFQSAATLDTSPSGYLRSAVYESNER